MKQYTIAKNATCPITQPLKNNFSIFFTLRVKHSGAERAEYEILKFFSTGSKYACNGCGKFNLELCRYRMIPISRLKFQLLKLCLGIYAASLKNIQCYGMPLRNVTFRGICL